MLLFSKIMTTVSILLNHCHPFHHADIYDKLITKDPVGALDEIMENAAIYAGIIWIRLMAWLQPSLIAIRPAACQGAFASLLLYLIKNSKSPNRRLIIKSADCWWISLSVVIYRHTSDSWPWPYLHVLHRKLSRTNTPAQPFTIICATLLFAILLPTRSLKRSSAALFTMTIRCYSLHSLRDGQA